MLHSAAALLRLAQLEYCGTTSFFMRVLLDKKYALPYRVIDALVGCHTESSVRCALLGACCHELRFGIGECIWVGLLRLCNGVKAPPIVPMDHLCSAPCFRLPGARVCPPALPGTRPPVNLSP